MASEVVRPRATSRAERVDAEDRRLIREDTERRDQRLRDIDQAFKQVFAGEQAELVLSVLRHECYVERTTNTEGSEHSMAVLEGRRQIWMLIQKHRKVPT